MPVVSVHENDAEAAAALAKERVTVAVRLRGNLTRAEQMHQCAVRHEVSGPDGAPCPAVLLTVCDFSSSMQPVKENHSFAFDCVFDDADGQAAVYDQVLRGDLVAALDEGTNVAVIAYGQTGSGKTHTILGPGVKQIAAAATSSPSRPSRTGAAVPPFPEQLAADTGLFHRMLDDLLELRSSQLAAGAECAVALTAVEVYNDDVFDLLVPAGSSTLPPTATPGRPSSSSAGAPAPATLRPPSAKIAFREVGEEMLLADPVVLELTSHADAAAAYALAASNRSTGATKMNDTSSRSHALFFVDVFRRSRAAGGAADCTTEALPFSAARLYAAFASLQSARASGRAKSSTGRVGSGLSGVTRSRICLADLAGNERVKKSAVSGEMLAEANHVNKSLSALGTVIHGIASGDPHIRFRDSKLTRLLRPTLASGTSRTKVLFTVSPVAPSAVESLATLRFAQRVKDLPLPKVKGHTLSVPEENAALEGTLAELHADVDVLHRAYGFTPTQRLAWSATDRRFGTAPRASRRAGSEATTKRLRAQLREDEAAAAGRQRELYASIKTAIDAIPPGPSADVTSCRFVTSAAGGAQQPSHVSDEALGSLERHACNQHMADAVLRGKCDALRTAITFCQDELLTLDTDWRKEVADREGPLPDKERMCRDLRQRIRAIRQECDAAHATLTRLCVLPQDDQCAADAAAAEAEDRSCIASWADEDGESAGGGGSGGIRSLVSAVSSWAAVLDELLCYQHVEVQQALYVAPAVGVASGAETSSCGLDNLGLAFQPPDAAGECAAHEFTTLSSDSEDDASGTVEQHQGRGLLCELASNKQNALRQRDAFRVSEALSACAAAAVDAEGVACVSRVLQRHPQHRLHPAPSAEDMHHVVVGDFGRDAALCARLLTMSTLSRAASDDADAWRWNAPACCAAGVLCGPIAAAISANKFASHVGSGDASDVLPPMSAAVDHAALVEAAADLASFAAQ